ncbi:hypothetical protein [Streptomyces sp. NPDC058268]|uniref:hypothetical protein n=1 Tax=Streptomyces sp. NPDC058268 TaxID=3346413 RepID=UPI0036E6DB48
MATPIERALADLRAVSMRESTVELQPQGLDACCSGDRPGYQWHQRSGNLPACEASVLANRAYMNDYQRSTGRTTRAGRRRKQVA